MTPAGRAVVLLAAAGWSLGVGLDWSELLYLGMTASLLLAVGLASVFVPRPARARVEARPSRTTVGSTAHVELTIEAGRFPLVTPMLEVLGEVGMGAVRVPSIARRGSHRTVFEVPTDERGVFALGPVHNVQSDLLGLFRRTHVWGRATELRVRPVVVMLEPLSLGGTFDPEGLPSDHLSMNDLAFHALREYVPGDDLRHVHWRSSAKADRLLVRQYLESRSMRATLVVDDDPIAYVSPEEFETAISIAASMALRALADGFEVQVTCGEDVISVAGPDLLLDATCELALGASAAGGLGRRASAAARRTTTTGLAVVISGAVCSASDLVAAVGSFAPDGRRIAVRVDAAGTSRLVEASGVRSLEIAELDQLPRLVSWVSA